MKYLILPIALFITIPAFAQIDILAKAYNKVGYQADWINVQSDNGVGIINDTGTAQTYTIYYYRQQ